MRLLLCAVAVSLIAILFPSTELSAQSIDCNEAITADELTVCERRGLLKLDHKLGQIYNQVLSEAHEDLDYMISEQQAAWFRARNRCRADRRCIRRHYRARISELSAWLTEPEEPEVAAGCMVYSDFNYGGQYILVKPNKRVSFLGSPFDNKASSVRLGGSCYIQGFTRAFHNGRGETYRQDTPRLGGMNDRISSVACICGQ